MGDCPSCATCDYVRHTLRARGSLPVLAKILEHADLRLLMRYVHPSQADMDRAKEWYSRWRPKAENLAQWQVNGIFTAETGLRLNITFSNTTLNAPGNNNRPSISVKPEIYGTVSVGQKWLDVTKFSVPAPNMFGTVWRNVLSGPGFVNLSHPER